MLKPVCSALVLGSAIIAFPAQAAVTIDGTSLDAIDGPNSSNGTTTIAYGDSGLDEPDFYEWLTFTNTEAGLYQFALDTSSPDIDFTEAFLTNSGGTVLSLIKLAESGPLEFWGASNISLDADQYKLNIYGANRGEGALAGNITITPSIPEPATWLMLLFGFAAIGAFMRSNGAGARATKRVRYNF